MKVTPLNQFRELQILWLFPARSSDTGTAGTGIEILGSFSARPLSLAMAALDAVLQLVLLSVQAERTLAGEVPDPFVLPQPGERVVHAVHVGDERHLRHLALDHILQSNNSQLTTLNTMTLLKRESRICGVQGIV